MLYLIGIPVFLWLYFWWPKASVDWDEIEDQALDLFMKQNREMEDIRAELENASLTRARYERRIYSIGNWVTLVLLVPVPVIELLRYPNLAEFYFGLVCLGYLLLHILTLSFGEKIAEKISTYRRRGLT